MTPDEVITAGLIDLANRLGFFDQTCHGVLSRGTIEEVAAALVEMSNAPSAHTISTFTQHVDRFVKIHLTNKEPGS